VRAPRINAKRVAEQTGERKRFPSVTLPPYTRRSPKVSEVFGALAKFERDIIKERTQAGPTAARSRGRLGGRPKVLTGKQARIARELYPNKAISISNICRMLKISRSTFYRYIKAEETS
jgi:DNA invertase Pin-like site-specific DNA recombinase